MSHPTATTPPRQALAKAAALLLPPVLGAALGYGVVHGALRLPMFRSAFAALSHWDLLLLPVVLLLVIAVHELGHVAAGVGRGMRFVLLIVGPFQLRRTPAGLRFGVQLNWRLAGGLAACMPDTARPTRPQLLALVTGGPAASLVLAAAALALAFADAGRASAWGLIIALLSGMIFLVTAAPLTGGTFMSDGAQLIELLRGGKRVESRHWLSLLMGQSLAGSRPVELDRDVLERALASVEPQSVQRIAAWYFVLLHAVDGGDHDTALAYAEKIARDFADYPPGFQASLAHELVIFHGLVRRDGVAAHAWADKVRGGLADPARRDLALALLARDVQTQARLIASARRNLARSSDPGVSRLTRDQIEALAARIGLQTAA